MAFDRPSRASGRFSELCRTGPRPGRHVFQEVSIPSVKSAGKLNGMKIAYDFLRKVEAASIIAEGGMIDNGLPMGLSSVWTFLNAHGKMA